MHALDSVAVNLTTKEYRVPESRCERALPAKSASTAKFIHTPIASPSLPATAPHCGGLPGGFFQGVGTGAWDRSLEPNRANQYRAAHRTPGRLLNLKDELSLIMELLLAGARGAR